MNGGPNSASVRVITSPDVWLQSQAVDQLRKTAQLPGARRAVAFPDLHPGPAAPVGAAVVTEGIVYPHLAGNDIGCGIGLWRTDLPSRRPNLDRWVKKLKGLESGPDDSDAAERVEREGLPATPADRLLGTIGGGNHFAELQAIDRIFLPDRLKSLGLEPDLLFLLIHSGSRGLGETILREHTSKHGSAGLIDETEQSHYLQAHDRATRWAALNRAYIAERFAEMIGTFAEKALDNCHNSIVAVPEAGPGNWLHRKGAADATVGALVIPGSRGTPSYLVQPINPNLESAHSLAHGAGRKWARSDARGRLSERYSPDSLSRTELGGRVICQDKDLIYEEAPQAYKEIETVIKSLVEAGLIEVIATLRPLISYKTRKQGE